MGAATRVLRRGCRQDQISSTRLHGSRDYSAGGTGGKRVYFIHAAPWEPRPSGINAQMIHKYISIHAAPWEPRLGLLGTVLAPILFPSTRLRGSRDSSGWCPAPGSGYFNPRGSVGAATKFRSYQSGCCSISIHAAPWEPRRDRERKHRQRIRISIHAAPWEPRRPAASAITTTASFQSTRLRGSRDLHPPVGWWRQTYFNPRGSVGAATKWAARRTKWQGISIHAARGSRDTSSLSTQSTLNAFQSTRLRGSRDKGVLHGRIKDSDFQSTRLRGSRDLLVVPSVLTSTVFPIHAAPWGAATEV